MGHWLGVSNFLPAFVAEIDPTVWTCHLIASCFSKIYDRGGAYILKYCVSECEKHVITKNQMKLYLRPSGFYRDNHQDKYE